MSVSPKECIKLCTDTILDDSSNSRYLTPAFGLTDPFIEQGLFEQNITSMMSPSEFEAYLKDIEPEIKQADRDLREIDALEKRGVSAAGNLGGL